MKSFDEYNWPMKNKDWHPFENQKKTTEFLLRNKRAYVLSEMRTGKTLSALWATDFLFHMERIRKVLVIAPLSTIKVVWAQAIFDNLPHRKYAIAHGGREARIRAIQSDAHYVLINHDGIKSCPIELINENFDVIIIDELTAYKNANNDRSETMKFIASKAKAVWGMTGNATPNSPSEAFGQAKVVNPGNMFLPKYFTRFKQMVETQIAPYVWVPKPDAKDVVYKVLQPSIRFTRAECFDIPPMIHTPIALEMSAEQKRVYEAVKNELYHEYDKGEITVVNAAVKLSKLLQICAGAVKNDDGGIYYLDDSPKVNYILEVLEESQRKKLVVASAFRASVERLHETFVKEKIPCEYIHGGVSPNKRAEHMMRFQNGDMQILVVQPQAVSHGTCFDATNMTIWHSITPSGETFSQMNDRIISASQKDKQYVEFLIGSKADQHMLDIVSRKKDISSSVMDMFANRDL